MAVTLEDVDHVARLARLGLADEERHALRADLESILGYVDLLRELEIPGEGPGVEGLPEDGCRERLDEVRQSQAADLVLPAAPTVDLEGRFFRVPKVLD